MTASALALPREVEVQSKIRNIRRFGRGARVVCAALFALSLVGGVLLMLLIALTLAFGPARENFWDDGDLHDVMRTVLTPAQFVVWVFFVLGALLGVWLSTLRQLERLFGSLASGVVHTAENVRCVRNVGLLSLLWPVLAVAIPTMHLIGLRSLDVSAPIDLDRIYPSLSELIALCATAGLVLLVSWIMDVGLYEKEHADALRQEADLTI